MAEEGKKSYSNIFIANIIYPEAKSIFSFHLAPIEQVKDDCYIVLDTNVLLAPYIIGKEDLLEQCRKTYGSLVAAKRLVIPGQVVREFARNRQEKLAELHQQLIRKKQIQLAKQDKYPLLSPLSEFKKVLRLGEEVNKKISEYQKAIDEVLAIIQGWHWNDPGVNPCDQTSVQVKLCCSESGPPQIPQEAHTRGWNVTASYCTHPR